MRLASHWHSALWSTAPGCHPVSQQPVLRVESEWREAGYDEGGSIGNSASRIPFGTTVKSRVGEKDIGEINDLIIDKDGQVVAVIVDVGGFLGMGSKSVAIDWQAVERTVDRDGKHVLHVNATEQTLKDTPEYRRD